MADELTASMGGVEDLEKRLAQKLFQRGDVQGRIAGLLPEEKEIAKAIQQLLLNPLGSNKQGVEALANNAVADFNAQLAGEGKRDSMVNRMPRAEVVLSKILGITPEGQDSVATMATERDSLLELLKSKIAGPTQRDNF